MNYGQINTLLMVGVVADCLAMPRRYRGWLVGLAGAVKLTPFVFLGLFVIQRDWRALARSTLAAAALTGLMWLKWPAASRAYWLHDVFNARRVGRVGYAGNQSWYGALHRWPFGSVGQSAVWFALVALTVVATAFVAWCSVQRHYPVQAMVALALGGLLISPISWTHHWVWVALIPLLLIGHQRSHLALSVRLMLAILLVISILGPYWWDPSAHAGVLLTDSLTLWAAVTLGVWAVAERRLLPTAWPIVRR
jgi:alpha-1,2-mannosyltransferase